ncbi:MAG: CHAD domain-containing protein [Steroidobacteraceae bacterium]
MTRPRNPPPPPPELPPLAEGSRRLQASVREQQRRITVGAARLAAAAVDDVHDARVAARRLRSLLKTFRPLLDPRRARLYRIDLRSFARGLAGAREADVRRELLVELGRREPSVSPSGYQRLSRLLEEKSLAARDGLRRHLAEPGWAALCRALQRQGASERLLVVRDADLARLLELVEVSWGKAVQLMEAEPEDVAGLHELRLAFKHCRYALEPVADVAPKSTARLLRRLRGAQDAIGEHRDLLLARHWVSANERSLGRPLVRRLQPLLETRETVLLHEAAVRSRKVLPAYREWRRAARRARKTVRERGNPGPA